VRPLVHGPIWVLAVLALADAAAQQRPTFSTAVAGVAIDVSVKNKNAPVTGLTAADFDLFDNGVRQEITAAGLETAELDVMLLLDASGSTDGPTRARMTNDLREVSRMLRPTDRLRLLLFGTYARDAFGTVAGGSLPTIPALNVGGATSFYNALASALTLYTPTDRRYLVFCLTDGADNTSVITPADLQDLAGRTDGSLYVALLGNSAYNASWGWVPYAGGANTKLLKDLTARTGGLFYDHPAENSLPKNFRAVLDEFRTSYVLRYTAQGVQKGGWHTVTVTTKDGRYKVRARPGYQG
jgi:VWFA-related protein